MQPRGSSDVEPHTAATQRGRDGAHVPGTAADIDHDAARKALLAFGGEGHTLEARRAVARLLREAADALGASCAALCVLSAEPTHADLILEYGPPLGASHLGSTPPFVEAGEPWPGVGATQGPPPPVLGTLSEQPQIARGGPGPGTETPHADWGALDAWAGGPIPGPDRPHGAVFFGRAVGAPFSEAAAGVVAAVAALVAQRVERAGVEALAHEHAVREDALAEVAAALIGSDDLEAVFEGAARTLRRIIACDGVRIWRLDATARTLELEASLGIPGDQRGTRIASDVVGPPEVEALEVGDLVTATDLAAPGLDVTDVLHAAGLQTGACCVIGPPQRRDGVIGVYFRGQRELPEESVQFLRSVANLLAGGLERRKAVEDLRQAQKLDAIGRLAGSIAHDFNNLLTVISGYVDIAQARIGKDHPAARALSEVELAAERATDLTAKLLTFSRHQKQERRPLDVGSVAQGMAGFMQRLIGEELDFALEVDEDLPVVRADRSGLEQVLLNLFVNARDAIGAARGEIRVRVRAADAGIAPVEVGGLPLSKPHVALVVSDTGTGMTPDVVERIFEPFFTTKDVGAGTGLGLASAYATVRQAGGEIRVQSTPGAGSTFAVLLPSATGVTALRVARPSMAVRGGSETVLVVEDRRAIREMAAAALEAQGYHVLAASDGVEALEVAAAHPSPIHLLVTDLIMPRMGGVELAQTMAEQHPDIRVLYVSGYPGADLSGHHGGAPVLKKPFAADELGYRVREALDGPS